MKRHLFVPEELHRNAPDVHVHGPENTGTALIRFAIERLGLSDLSDSDVLDVGCGVRFTQAIINRGITIKSYTGVDVHQPLIDYLRKEVDDPRFSFAHWDARNAKYNPTGKKITPESLLPVGGDFDIIWLFSVFTHLDPSDASALLAILRRYVRPSGSLFFSAFLDNTIATFETRDPARPLDQPCYSEGFLRKLAQDRGWRVAMVGDPSLAYFCQHHLVCHPD